MELMVGRQSTQERFWAKVDKTETCWLWRGALSRTGYAAFALVHTSTVRKAVKAHRQAWEWLRGPIPADREIDHLCRVRHCVNPDHLEVVTHAVNMARSDLPAMVAHRRGTCAQGHGGEALIRDKRTGYVNGCKECRKEYMRKWLAARPGYHRKYSRAYDDRHRSHGPTGRPRGERITLVCARCNESFAVVPSKANQRFCTPKCWYARAGAA